MRKRIYVAVHGATDRRIIRCTVEPTYSDHREAGEALYVIGPFRTLAGARRCVAPHGPQMQTVAEYEYFARIGR